MYSHRRSYCFRKFLAIIFAIYCSGLYLFYSAHNLSYKSDDELFIYFNENVSRNQKSQHGDAVTMDDILYSIPVPRKVYHDNSARKLSLLQESKRKDTLLDNVAERLNSKSTRIKLSEDNLCLIINRNLAYNEFIHLDRVSAKFVYSAYLDDRKNGPNYIRMIIMRKIKLDQNVELDCVFGKIITPLVYYTMSENHHMIYGGFIGSCEVPKKVTHPLCQIQVRFRTFYRTATNKVMQYHYVLVPLQHIEKHPDRQDLAICVAPLFGNLPKERIIEFVEIQKLLGANKVFFYDYKIPDETRPVIEHYIKEKIVILLPWKLPRILWETSVWYHGQMLAINDCIYRTMAEFRYTAVHDLDEIIVPRHHPSIPAMMDHMTKDDKVAFCFPTAYFLPQNNTHVSDILFLRHQNRSKHLNHVLRKCVSKPRKIFEHGIHHISKPNEEHYQIVSAGASVAVVHHYRKCHLMFIDSCSPYRKDNTTHTYAQDLQKNFQKVSKMFQVQK